MTTRIDITKVAPAAVRPMLSLEEYLHKSEIERSLIALVKMRVSYMNGCAYCLDMHSKDARAAGETEQRLYAVAAWHETSFFTPRERAAFAWAESVTELGRHGVPDELYQETLKEFSERELVDLTMVVIAINGWNRLAISLRPAEPGSYQVRKTAA